MTIRVLLADDHTIIRDGLRLLLEAQPDIQVVANAADGLQAVEQAQALQPDIVVIDITTPRLNGIEATRQIRERCPHTQVIVLSIRSRLMQKLVIDGLPGLVKFAIQQGLISLD